MSLPILPFHKSILEELSDPATSELLILARGLGLRRVICTLLKIYDSPENLVLIVNASPEEESALGQELGIMGCRNPGLRIVGYEVNSKERHQLYQKGGLISVTSRILVVDMLQSDIPIDLITGIVILNAEKVTALALEAFIVRLYREKNKVGFLKAFTDQPEHITSGLSPLKNVMKELQLRKVHLYPRFHETVKESLERRRADVIELMQPLTPLMDEIHGAIVHCMTLTLTELKRTNTSLDLDDFKIENAYFRSFDAIVRRQLDSVWSKVGPATKQLVSDLATLRRLLLYLLTYDSLKFYAYIESLIAANSSNSSGNARQNQSPWLLTDAANIIVQGAKSRCFTFGAPKSKPVVIDLADDEDGWDALLEVEGRSRPSDEPNKQPKRLKWVPDGMEPILEELPKWSLLSEILQEIEGEVLRQESLKVSSPGSNTVLIMTSSMRSCELISDFLSVLDPEAPAGSQGRPLMERKLRLYLWWKRKLKQRKDQGLAGFALPELGIEAITMSDPSYGGGEEVNEALRLKDKQKADRNANRRRVRGGGTTGAVASREKLKPKIQDDLRAQPVVIDLESMLIDQGLDAELQIDVTDDLPVEFSSLAFSDDYDSHFGLLAPEQTVIVRAYGDDNDDRVLSEIQPKFIVMFEPSMEFVRRVEVYRSGHPGMAVRVYHMVYSNSCEEHKYLAGIRREKDSFERMIKERGSMLMPIFEDRVAGTSTEAILKTISTRVGGGRRELNLEPSRVIVDMREFRSTLPSLLHASNLLVVPATLTVGDYILTNDICVERKSIPDLIQSFSSGRLYTQCELMSTHYKQPVLLIEFEEDKAFNLEIVEDFKSYAKPSGKYPPKKRTGEPDQTAPTLQGKIVLLTLTFPRLRIIWASSPYATADIFNDLKHNNPEPDAAKAVAIGAEGDPNAGAGVNAAAEELLASLPGITPKNIKHVMSKVQSVRHLCEMKLEEVQALIGVEPGKACYDFMHKGVTRKSTTSIR